MPVEVIKAVSEVAKEAAKEASKEVAKKTKEALKELDKPLGQSEISESSIVGESDFDSTMKELDQPLNSEPEIKDVQKPEGDVSGKNEVQALNESSKGDAVSDTAQDTLTEVNDVKDINNVEKMEPQITIEFSCPEGMDKKEFSRQLKGQERGLNSQTIAENMDNRAVFEQRKMKTGNGRDTSEGKKAQDITREKETQSRIESNRKKGMSYSDAKAEAQEWIKTRAVLHNPDQIAGGDPGKVSGMGDAKVNSSIGSQWRTRVGQLSKGVEDYAKDKTREELENTKMNVKLVAV